MKFVIGVAILLSPMLHASQPHFWKNLCERYIVAEDPYQYENLSVDQLVTVFYVFKDTHHYSRTLHMEIIKRLEGKLERDDREILSKLKFDEVEAKSRSY